jgi:membrane protease YdiL (CAAX protease family)
MDARYVIHFAAGGVHRDVDRDTVRALISAGQVTEADRVSRNGSSPAEFFCYDEFVDLWDADADFRFGGSGAFAAVGEPADPATAAPAAAETPANPAAAGPSVAHRAPPSRRSTGEQPPHSAAPASSGRAPAAGGTRVAPARPATGAVRAPGPAPAPASLSQASPKTTGEFVDDAIAELFGDELSRPLTNVPPPSEPPRQRPTAAPGRRPDGTRGTGTSPRIPVPTPATSIEDDIAAELADESNFKRSPSRAIPSKTGAPSTGAVPNPLARGREFLREKSGHYRYIDPQIKEDTSVLGDSGAPFDRTAASGDTAPGLGAPSETKQNTGFSRVPAAGGSTGAIPGPRRDTAPGFNRTPSGQGASGFVRTPSQDLGGGFGREGSNQGKSGFVRSPSARPATGFSRTPSNRPATGFSRTPSNRPATGFVRTPSNAPDAGFGRSPSAAAHTPPTMPLPNPGLAADLLSDSDFERIPTRDLPDPAETLFPPGVSQALRPAPDVTTTGTFLGYDALSDDQLDPLTIRDLLYDSSLYSVLAVSDDASTEQLNAGYLRRAELITSRQRTLTLDDLRQVAALEDIRRLVFHSFEYLRDQDRRTKHDAYSAAKGGFPSSQLLLGARALDPQSPEFLASGTYAAVRAAAGRIATKTGSITVDGPRLAVTADRRVARRDSGQGLNAFAPPDDQSAGPPGVDVPRTYSSAHKVLASGEHEPIEEPADSGSLFSADVPSAAQQAEEELRRRRTRESRLTGSGRKAAVDASPLEWGSAAGPHSRAIPQAIVTTVLLCAVSLVVVLYTNLGPGEVDWEVGPPWLFGRNALLVGMAFLGTLALRRDPPKALGLEPSPGGIIFGLIMGGFLGFVGAYVSPPRAAHEINMALVFASCAAQAIGHEFFFRGFITRTFLVEMRSPLIALTLSCVFYSVFWMTFYSVLQNQGFWLLYTVLLFGCGVGGIFAYLFYRTKCVWTVTIAHFMMLFVSFFIANQA